VRRTIEVHDQKFAPLKLTHIELNKPLWENHAISGSDTDYENLCTTDFVVALTTFRVLIQPAPHSNQLFTFGLHPGGILNGLLTHFLL